MTRISQTTAHYPKTLLLAIEAPYNITKDIEAYFEEFKNLAKVNGVVFEHYLTMKLRKIDPAYFISEGKLKEVHEICEKNNIRQVIISEPLTTKQERNLGDYLHCEIYDRTELILEIFEKAAHTNEGKFQVEIAMLKHLKSRIAGKGIQFSQQSSKGGRGLFVKGIGETAKEKEIRHLEDRILKLRKGFERLQQVRETQRKRRIQSKIPQICLIGYTNAGKSTILNTLTKSNVLAEDKLFATLDTTTRELYINSKKKGIISDTVGFIQQLPHQLIEAFKSTLSELQYADLLLQVVDIADKNWESQIIVVNEILEELGVQSKMLYVFNKADKVQEIETLSHLISNYQPHVIISAISKEGIQPLIDYLDSWNPDKKQE
jgi:GTPase